MEGRGTEYGTRNSSETGFRETFQEKALIDVLSAIWKLSEPPSFQRVENNILLVNLVSEADRNRIIEGGPWSFEGEALIMQKWNPGMTADDFDSTKISIFVQLTRPPFELRKDASIREVVEKKSGKL